MLYRPLPRPALIRIRAAFAGVAGALAALRRSSADTAYLHGLNDNELRDLGISRCNERGDIFYR
ncbi:MAG: hypothetical protein EOP22_12130 [Hyphomicrobiales bacterium]|nr:MAG: hypothetical protein EOP22_12130 [Hyphomicrobiales bacterium]